MEVRLIKNKELLESVDLWVYWIRSGGRIVYQTCV